MPGDRVNRLDLTAKTRLGTRIDQGQLRLAEALLQFFGTQQHMAVGLAFECPAQRRRGIQAQREARAMPGLEAAIKDKHAITLAQPGQQPPCASGKSARAIVIQHHIAVGIDAPGLQTLNQGTRVGQWMAAGHALDHRPAQVAFKIGKLRTGNMPLGIAAAAVVRVFKGKAAIQNNQAGLRLTFIQGLRADQLRNGHSGLL